MALLVGGIVALVVAMGIGRFAYTPILPLMKSEAGLSDAFAGIVAAGNYAGYLAGALWAAHPFWKARRVVAIRWALGTAAATTFGMGFTANGIAWLALRFVGGVASAFILILVSSIVLDVAHRERRTMWPGLLYGGVGAGIALTGIAVPLLAPGGWRLTWIGLGIASALLSATIFGTFGVESVAAPVEDATPERANGWTFWPLVLAYFGDGVGYIVPATFLVAILRATPQLAPLASFAWVLVGIVAAPSAIAWNYLGARFGRLAMLCLALVILATGVVAPVYAPNVAGAAFSALALGATFIGITALVNVEARALFPRSSNRAIGQLTAAFGVGQIIGPLIVSALAATGGTYNTALIVAGVVLLASAAVVAIGIVGTLVTKKRVPA
jgi:MFS family permease